MPVFFLTSPFRYMTPAAALPAFNQTIHQCRGALLGLAVGDALGVPVEFAPRAVRRADPVTTMRSFGTHHQPAGTWSDDAALTFCLAEALAGQYAVQALAAHFVRWYRQGWWSAHQQVFDIGITTRQALQRLEQGVDPVQAGGREESSNGNGALMRILPLAFYREQAPVAERFAQVHEVAALTHGHIRSTMACWLYLEMARHLRAGMNPAAAYAQLCQQAPAQFGACRVPAHEVERFERILSGHLATVPETDIASSGYVLHTLEAALWCLLRYTTYAETVLAAVNLGDDTDTTAAVAGGLAGLYYGEAAIPAEWLADLARRGDIEDLATRLAVRCDEAASTEATTAEAAHVVLPPRPFPNSYWASPAVLACEYPGDRNPSQARSKLVALLEAGITDFYDLTEAGELLPYEPLLQQVAAARGVAVHYLRFPIVDASVPAPATLEAVLEALAATLAAGRKAAVHCWGGVGRTGTVVGCHLIRTQQISGQEALAHIAQQWQTVAKSDRIPHSPETAAQFHLVESFR